MCKIDYTTIWDACYLCWNVIKNNDIDEVLAKLTADRLDCSRKAVKALRSQVAASLFTTYDLHTGTDDDGYIHDRPCDICQVVDHNRRFTVYARERATLTT